MTDIVDRLDCARAFFHECEPGGMENLVGVAAEEIEYLRATLRTCDRGLNQLIAKSDAFLVADLQKIIKEALGDE